MLLRTDGDRGHIGQAAGRGNCFASAVSQCRGSTSVRGGCGARPLRMRVPSSASRMTTLQDWVEESTPATSGTPRSR